MGLQGSSHSKRLRVLRGGKTQTPSDRFTELYRESYSLVYNYVLFRMADRDAAETVVAEAFLKAARAFDRYDESRAKFSTWVIAIARNCMTDYRNAHKPTVDLDEVPPTHFAVVDAYPTVNEDAEFARALLKVLDDDERELVYCKYYLGLRNVDIAERLGMNASTVATKLSRALDKMRAEAQRIEGAQT